MQFLDAEFGQLGKPNVKRKGKLAVCSDCDNREWIVFQLDGQDHFHLQCSMCGTSYCPLGKCGEEEQNLRRT